MYCEILSPDSIIASHLLVYAIAFLAAVVILCDTKLVCVRGRQPDSLLFFIPGGERFRSKASTTISVGRNFSFDADLLSEARKIKIRFLGFAAFVIVSIGKMINIATLSYLV